MKGKKNLENMKQKELLFLLDQKRRKKKEKPTNFLILTFNHPQIWTQITINIWQHCSGLLQLFIARCNFDVRQPNL